MATEITVVGAGIFGLACAWELRRRGAAVRVVEIAHPGAGSSGGTVGALAPHVPENWNDKKQMQLDALIAAEGWWGEITRAGGFDPGYARAGRIQPVTGAERARWQARAAEARARWPASASLWLTDRPEGALVPESADGLWVADNLTARISPRRAVAALAAALGAEGVVIDCGSGAAWSGNVAGPVVWATGVAGLDALSDDLGRSVGGPVKGQSALLSAGFDAAAAPQVFAEGIHIVPHADGSIAVGSTSERDQRSTETDDQLDALIARAVAVCPALDGAAVVDRWAGLRPRAASRAPLIGAWPGRPGQFVANGGFKIGFAMAQPAAVMLADLIVHGVDRIPDGMRPGP